MNRTVNTVSALLAVAAAFAAFGAYGQAYPSKPIKVVIPFVAGGSSDIVGRALGSKFQEFLGQPAIVENKPGANGSIAAEFVAKSDPDGYTILVGSIGVFSINAALFKDLRYNPLRDFAPLTLAVTTPNVLITRPDLPAGTMKELVEFAKKNPGRISYCSSGTGSSDHLTGEVFKQGAGITAVHVPYKGGAACQEVTTRSGKPASAAVGTFGICGLRAVAVTASAFIFPALM